MTRRKSRCCFWEVSLIGSGIWILYSQFGTFWGVGAVLLEVSFESSGPSLLSVFSLSFVFAVEDVVFHLPVLNSMSYLLSYSTTLMDFYFSENVNTKKLPSIKNIKELSQHYLTVPQIWYVFFSVSYCSVNFYFLWDFPLWTMNYLEMLCLILCIWGFSFYKFSIELYLSFTVAHNIIPHKSLCDFECLNFVSVLWTLKYLMLICVLYACNRVKSCRHTGVLTMSVKACWLKFKFCYVQTDILLSCYINLFLK